MTGKDRKAPCNGALTTNLNLLILYYLHRLRLCKWHMASSYSVSYRRMPVSDVRLTAFYDFALDL